LSSPMTVVSTDEPGRWTAWHDGHVTGTLWARVRPDGRCYLSFRDCSPEAYAALLETALRSLDQDLYVELGENDVVARRAFLSQGFVLDRQEHHFLLATDPTHIGASEPEVPDGFDVISAADAANLTLASTAPVGALPGVWVDRRSCRDRPAVGAGGHLPSRPVLLG
jgi:hypothetical protein